MAKRASHKREKYVDEKEKVSRGAMGFPSVLSIALRRSDRLFILQEVIFIYEVLG